MAKNTYHGEPLQFVSLTPAAMPAAAKVAKIKAQHNKAEAQAAVADAAEAVYQAGIHAFLAGAAQAANPHLPADAMHWAWQEGWLDAQAYHGHPPANTPSHADLGRSHIASAMLYVLAGAVLLGVMVWHSARVDGKLAAAPAAQPTVTAGVRQ